MKKTLTLLLAAASVALAANVTEQLQPTEDKMSFSLKDIKFENDLAITVAVSIDWTKLTGDTYQDILAICGPNVLNNNTVGVGAGFYFGSDINNTTYSGGITSYNNDYKPIGAKSVESAVLVFTSNLTSLEFENGYRDINFISSLYVWGKDAQSPLLYKAETKGSSNINGLTTLYFDNNLIKEVEVFNEKVEDKEALATAIKEGTLHSIPEPATATLSLLALAGLAARRRR